MRVLVTGATGFVGSHLVRALAQDHEVVATARRDIAIDGASEVRTVPRVDSSTEWNGLLEDIDTVIHLAARVHVMKETAEDPLESFREVNARGTERLAEACAAQGVRRFVFMSSIKVNGEATAGRPYTALDAPAPVDPYGVSKMEAETALDHVASSTGLEVVKLRPTVIYGSGVKGNIDRVMRMVRTRVPVPLGSVSNQRSLLSIRNLVHWVEEALTAPPPATAVLVADPQPISTAQLIRSLAQGMGHRALLVPVPLPLLRLVGELLHQGPALQRLLGDLAVHPTVSALPGVKDRLHASEEELVRLGAEQHSRLGARQE